MVFKAVYHFVDSNLGVEISWKKRVYRKRGGVSEVVLPRRGGEMTHLGKGRVCLGDQR